MAEGVRRYGWPRLETHKGRHQLSPPERVSKERRGDRHRRKVQNAFPKPEENHTKMAIDRCGISIETS